jgi:hypothetical protein
MSMVTEYFVEILGVVFDKSFDIMSDVKSNDIFEILGCDIGIFLFNDGMQFLK